MSSLTWSLSHYESAHPETESRMQCVCVCVRLGRGWNRRAESAEPVAATVGQRAGGVSLPRGDIISCVLSAGRRCRHKGRGRAKDRGGGCRHRRGRVGFKAGVRGLPTPTLPHHQRSLRSRVGRTIRSMRSNLVHSHNLLFLFPIEKSDDGSSAANQRKCGRFLTLSKTLFEAPDEAKYTNPTSSGFIFYYCQSPDKQKRKLFQPETRYRRWSFWGLIGASEWEF